MKTHTNRGRAREKFPSYGYFGLALILAAEALLFAGNVVVGHWFTPIVWTGYIFLTRVDLKIAGRRLKLSAVRFPENT